ncbi:MAG: hypothetical protein U1E45_05420 [Geminicoccaceae bacterium]
MKVVMIPSTSGGMGHVSRTVTLANALRRLDPAVEIEFVFDAERLRPFNIDALLKLGYRPRLMPRRLPDSRGPIVRACLGDADVIVDDVMRFLLPLRVHIPQAAWISIAMHPIGDELFMEWPHLAQMDGVIWPYPPAVGLPSGLEIVADKVATTGPFLDLDDIPDRRTARARLGIDAQEVRIVYAPRGFPFGKDFGHAMVSGIYAAAERLRREHNLPLRLVFLAVADPSDLRDVEGFPTVPPPWVSVLGLQTQTDALLQARAADILVAEGTSTIHEGAALGTPLVLVPGPITEILLLTAAMKRQGAAQVIDPETVGPESFATAFSSILFDATARRPALDRARAMVAGGGGTKAAAEFVLNVGRRHRGSRSGEAAA